MWTFFKLGANKSYSQNYYPIFYLLGVGFKEIEIISCFRKINLVTLKLNSSLGNLTYLKIWHDNSGKGDMASWFLKHIIVHDLQTNEKFYFLCEKWLAVEKSDGKLERELFISCDPQKTELKHNLKKHFKFSMNDSHLWFSIFNRPVNSLFTRLDRVTCCFVFVYVSMLLNILYYEKSFLNSGVSFNLGYFSITSEQVKENSILKLYLY